MILNKLKKISCLLCTILTVSCLHRENDLPIAPYLVDVELSLNINVAMEADNMLNKYASILDKYDMRYIVDICEGKSKTAGSGETRVRRIVKSSSHVIINGNYRINEKLSLPAHDYKLMVWLDFVPRGSLADAFYNTADLEHITKREPTGDGHGYNVAKDAFAAVADLDLRPYAGERSVNHNAEIKVARPFAAYRIIATGAKGWAPSAMPRTTAVDYQFFFPCGYNIGQGSPDNLRANQSYTCSVTDGELPNEMLLASDLVFVGDDTFYTLDLEVFSQQDKHITFVPSLKIPLHRNRMTTIRGDFLSKNADSGGIGIDDNFDGEIVIEIE